MFSYLKCTEVTLKDIKWGCSLRCSWIPKLLWLEVTHFVCPYLVFYKLTYFSKDQGTENFGKRMRNEEHLKAASSHEFLTLLLTSCPLSFQLSRGEKEKSSCSPLALQNAVPACTAWLVRQVLCLPGHTWTGPFSSRSTYLRSVKKAAQASREMQMDRGSKWLSNL